jgi:ribosomal protein S18 acetylase RimI-like enzyme
MRIRPYAAGDETAVIDLWEECRLTRPWNDPRKDIARKLAVQPELFLVGVLGEAIVATVMAGYEGHRGCPKLNVQVRAANSEALQFYRRLGYAQDEALALGKRLIPDA